MQRSRPVLKGESDYGSRGGRCIVISLFERNIGALRRPRFARCMSDKIERQSGRNNVPHVTLVAFPSEG